MEKAFVGVQKVSNSISFPTSNAAVTNLELGVPVWCGCKDVGGTSCRDISTKIS